MSNTEVLCKTVAAAASAAASRHHLARPLSDKIAQSSRRVPAASKTSLPARRHMPVVL